MVTETYFTGLAEVANFNTSGMVDNFTERMNHATTYGPEPESNRSDAKRFATGGLVGILENECL